MIPTTRRLAAFVATAALVGAGGSLMAASAHAAETRTVCAGPSAPLYAGGQVVSYVPAGSEVEQEQVLPDGQSEVFVFETNLTGFLDTHYLC